jgi:hypothetical protein
MANSRNVVIKSRIKIGSVSTSLITSGKFPLHINTLAAY